MRKLHLYAATSAIAMVACFATQEANAQVVYSGGGTLAAKVYRQLFDCYDVPITGDTINANCPSSTGDVGGTATQILYAAVGSGGGKRALAHDDGSSSGVTGLGSTPQSNPAFYSTYVSTSTSFTGYANFHFAGSDDPITTVDLNTYSSYVIPSGPNAGKTTEAATGAIMQVPGMVVDVAIVINGKDGNGNPLNDNVNPTPTGGTSGLNLSRQALCGIFSGHITQWNNTILTALNGGTVLGSGNITVVHRSDGSGTTFLTTNALVGQCSGVSGPTSESNTTPVSYAFPLVDAASSPACLFVEGSDVISWPDEPNGCSTPSVGGTWTNASGSGGVQVKVISTNGAIGYLSPDYTAEVLGLYNASTNPTGGPAAANLQNQWDLNAAAYAAATGGTSAATWEPPSPGGATTAVSSATAQFDATNIADPLAWSSIGVIPNPQVQGAYPIAGFTWLDFYQCYSNSGTETGVLGAIQSYLGNFHYSSIAGKIFNSNGFAGIPGDASTLGTWLGDIDYLMTQSSAAWINCSHQGTGA